MACYYVIIGIICYFDTRWQMHKILHGKIFVAPLLN